MHILIFTGRICGPQGGSLGSGEHSPPVGVFSRARLCQAAASRGLGRIDAGGEPGDCQFLRPGLLCPKTKAEVGALQKIWRHGRGLTS
jgi:hypothetical protein